MARWISLFVAAVVGPSIVSAAQPVEPIRGRAMGTSYTIKLADDVVGERRDELARAVAAELERLEEIFSLYRENSELSRWNTAATEEWINVSPDLYRVAAYSLRLAEAAGGAFDPTIAPLARVWGLREFAVEWRPPSPEEIEASLADVGADQIELRADPPALRKRNPRVGLDLNAVVEGYAIDRLIDLLKGAGVRGALVELGGEFRSLGLRNDGTPWRVGIEDPRRPAQLYSLVDLSGDALATSGDYRQARVYEGRRYSHLLDARNGAPIQHSCTAVSVLADDALTADGWATALLILGPKEGRAVAERHGLAASFVLREPADAEAEFTSAAKGRFMPPLVKSQSIAR